MKFLGLRYKASEFLNTIKAKRGMKTFNKEVFFVLCSLGKCRLSRSYKMPIIGQSTTCKVFNMGDVITPSHLR